MRWAGTAVGPLAAARPEMQVTLQTEADAQLWALQVSTQRANLTHRVNGNVSQASRMQGEQVTRKGRMRWSIPWEEEPTQARAWRERGAHPYTGTQAHRGTLGPFAGQQIRNVDTALFPIWASESQMLPGPHSLTFQRPSRRTCLLVPATQRARTAVQSHPAGAWSPTPLSPPWVNCP